MPRTWQRVATNPPGQMQLRRYPPTKLTSLGLRAGMMTGLWGRHRNRVRRWYGGYRPRAGILAVVLRRLAETGAPIMVSGEKRLLRTTFTSQGTTCRFSTLAQSASGTLRAKHSLTGTM